MADSENLERIADALEALTKPRDSEMRSARALEQLALTFALMAQRLAALDTIVQILQASLLTEEARVRAANDEIIRTLPHD